MTKLTFSNNVDFSCGPPRSIIPMLRLLHVPAASSLITYLLIIHERMLLMLSQPSNPLNFRPGSRKHPFET